MALSELKQDETLDVNDAEFAVAPQAAVHPVNRTITPDLVHDVSSPPPQQTAEAFQILPNFNSGDVNFRCYAEAYIE